MLLPPGADSHSFEPSPRDIITIKHSDIFIYVGESEQWIQRVLHSMDTNEMTILAMANTVELLMNIEYDHDVSCDDPDCFDDHHTCSLFDEHVWTSPRNAIQIVRVITELLSSADPSNAAYYRQNAAAYIRELEQLDIAFTEVVAGARRRTIVFGDRMPFRYLVEAYGLTWHAAFDGCSTQTEPSAARVAFLINTIRAERIPVVFHIELSNERMADAIAGETGARKLLLHSVHNVSRRDFEAGLGYLELMRRNVENLRIALH
jgi:zinc transport system substrate-binding protein